MARKPIAPEVGGMLPWFRPLVLEASGVLAQAHCGIALTAGRTCYGPRSGPQAKMLEEGRGSSRATFVPVGMLPKKRGRLLMWASPLTATGLGS